MFEMGMTTWDTVITRRLHDVSPKAVSTYVDADDPRVVQAIQRVLGRKIINDIYYGKATLAVEGEHRTVAEVLVGHIYPGMIHIADLEFSDPYSPIPEEQRQYRYTEYRGLGLLGTFVDHVVSLARELGVHEVTLTAATADHVPLFERHDFVIANSPRAKIAEKAGIAVPMIRTV